MATNFRFTGKRLPVASASAAITSGQFVVQEGIFGIALTTVASGGSLWIGTEGVWNLPVPSTAANKGSKLFASAMTDAINPTLTVTSTGAFLVGVTVGDRDASGNALVVLGPQGAGAWTV